MQEGGQYSLCVHSLPVSLVSFYRLVEPLYSQAAVRRRLGEGRVGGGAGRGGATCASEVCESDESCFLSCLKAEIRNQHKQRGIVFLQKKVRTHLITT